MINWLSIAVIIGSYLLGSIPSAYLAGKWSKGKDMTKVGTGTTGAANVWQTVSRRVGILAFLADIVKGAIPPLVALQLGLGLYVQMAGGLAAVVGHNWPVFLKFRGGRGIATIIGVLLVLALKELALAILIALIGTFFRQHALSVLVGIVLLPLAGWYFGQPQTVITGEVVILLLVVSKRLEANRRPVAPSAKRWQVLLYRFLFDRDIKDRKAWISCQRDDQSPPRQG